MGISGVGSFPVWSGGSLIFLQHFRSRNLALNGIDHLHLDIVLGCVEGSLACLCV